MMMMMILKSIMRARLVSPVAHIKLIREASRLCVESEEPGVLGRSMLTELAKDERTVADHLEVGPAVVRCHLRPRDQSVVFRLVVGVPCSWPHSTST
jgi:hypothetical protein